MKDSPTVRTLKYYKDLGWPVCVTEKWNPWAGIRQDLFGFIDLVTLSATDIIAVQTTSGANHAARINKILCNVNAFHWLRAGGKIVVMSWRKKANGRYDRREEELTLDMFQSA